MSRAMQRAPLQEPETLRRDCNGSWGQTYPSCTLSLVLYLDASLGQRSSSDCSRNSSGGFTLCPAVSWERNCLPGVWVTKSFPQRLPGNVPSGLSQSKPQAVYAEPGNNSPTKRSGISGAMGFRKHLGSRGCVVTLAVKDR